MSLATDSIFIAAISDSSKIMDEIGGRLYSTAIPLPDEETDNVDVPYIIVTFDGLTNDQTTKDDPFESDSDSVKIGIEITAVNREQLATLTQKVREVVHQSMLITQQSDDGVAAIDDYAFSAGAVQYDQLKPCYWQVLSYQCSVANTINNEQD